MLHILPALAGGELHGYGIMQEISRHTDGDYKLGPGTLYDNLQRLLEQGWISGTTVSAGGGQPCGVCGTRRPIAGPNEGSSSDDA